MSKTEKKSGKNINIGYRISKIHTTKFSYTELDEAELSTLFQTPNGLNVNFNITMNINKDTSRVTIDISSELFDTKAKRALVNHTGRTTYFVQGLEQTYNEEMNAYDLPKDLLLQLNSIAYTHARALLSTEISPTCYHEKYFLPVINPQILLEYSDEK